MSRDTRKVYEIGRRRFRLSYPQRRFLCWVYLHLLHTPRNGYQWRTLRALLKMGLIKRDKRRNALHYVATANGNMLAYEIHHMRKAS